MKCLVTGGAGFVGSNLVDRLVELGHIVVIIDDLSWGKESNVQKCENIIFYKRNICEDLSEIFEKENPEVVFHLAALPGVQFSMQNPEKTHEVNVNGTFNLLLACKKAGVKRFVFSSSSAVYGAQDNFPWIETMELKPLSPYAVHKLIGEHYCKLFNELYGLQAISLRYTNIYGPRQNVQGEYAGLIPKFISMLKEGIKPIINGDGEQTRDFIYVSDVVEANILAGITENTECFGNVFNIGAGENKSVNEVVHIIKEICKSSLEIAHGPALIEPRNSLAGIEKAKAILGWEPRFSFEEGLEKTYEFYSSKK